VSLYTTWIYAQRYKQNSSQGFAGCSGEGQRHKRGDHNKHGYAEVFAKGQVQPHQQRTFWTCREILLPLYITYQKISGPYYSQNYEGISERYCKSGKRRFIKQQTSEIAKLCSERERAAEEAERETEELKKVEFMKSMKDKCLKYNIKCDVLRHVCGIGKHY